VRKNAPKPSTTIDAPVASLCADGLISPTAAAEFLSISRTSLYELLKSGAIPYTRIGADKKIPRRALVEFAEARLVERARA
jgi:excisionase family DNA binding protein